MGTFSLDQDNRFIIHNYPQQRPFSSLLPGIAGPLGIPMWVFYVNRGQAIAGFGTENKDHPIMEFQPANKAYQVTPFRGFRTFIKFLDGTEPEIYEPFAVGGQSRETRLIISLNELELQERHPARDFQVEVVYFTLPEARVAGLVRQVRLTNLGRASTRLEILDGLPVMIPYGVTNEGLKETHRTLEAWMDVYNLEHKAPFFRLRSSPGDTAEVRPVRAGNYALATAEWGTSETPLAALVDPELVFGYDTSLSFPANFQAHSLAELLAQTQHPGGRTPCAIFGCTRTLEAGESLTLNSIYGQAGSLDILNEISPHLRSGAYLSQKRAAAQALVAELTQAIDTRTGMPLLDAYCRQTFLDNLLRGGWPIHLGSPEKPVTYHIYSRKHGDPERDYNAFFLAAEYYSQGNGNYRDVNQNRRDEVWFDPRVEDANVRAFMSLIQADGYNPLVVKGSRFRVPPDRQHVLLALVGQPERLKPFLEQPFTPGGLLRWVDEQNIELLCPSSEFIEQALQAAEQNFEADFGEGYWIDHWTYNLDLIENYLSVYPDRVETLLFGREDFPYYESAAFVRPRGEKYVLAGGHARQYEAVAFDEEKAALIAARRENPHWLRTRYGRGEVYRTNLYTKLFTLALLKFATLDPEGMGVEMEAGRPGWCDALNGLPGLFGSSLSETFELERLLEFLRANLPAGRMDGVSLPVELAGLLANVSDCLLVYKESEDPGREFHYWDGVSTARETYRMRTRLGFDGETKTIPLDELAIFLDLMYAKVQFGLTRASQLNGGLPPTYFFYEVEGYELLTGPGGQLRRDAAGRPYLRVSRFRQHILPLFLEGVVRMFKTLPDVEKARIYYQKVKQSSLYDRVLKMYKTNAPLEGQPLEIGRLRAFTPGWLENESVFLHMEYKYLLELLKTGLYEEFWEDIRNALVAFQDPTRYGRSPLENSSFIVSSAHPDPKLHGAGFVARLTGANAEFLSMWTLMMAGPDPFFVADGVLGLRLRPALPGWLFDPNGQISFMFLGRCRVTYFNPARRSTFAAGMQIENIHLEMDGESVEIAGDVIPAPYAARVRAGQVQKIQVFLTSTEH